MQTTDAKWQAMLDTLNASPFKIALVVAGGGTAAISQCFRREGASQTFVEAVIPYSQAAMADYLGKAPMGHASARTANQLALRAHDRAVRLCAGDESSSQFIGISLVAALPTRLPRRSDDRIHVALNSHQHQRHWSLILGLGACTRQFAETVSDELLFKSLAQLVADHSNDSFFAEAGLIVESAP